MRDSSNTPMQSPDPSPSDEHEDDSPWQAHDQHGVDSIPGTPEARTPTGGKSNSNSAPMQKRRRVTRACDECRRKKIKCDGKQPCTHCTVYSYECTYDQPSNRRRNPAPQYIEALENRLHKTEAILRSVIPGIDLDDPKYDARGIDQIIESENTKSTRPKIHTPKEPNPEDDPQIHSMVENTGSLDLDDQGHWDFHGHSSGFSFMLGLRAQFGDLSVPDPRIPTHRSRPFAQLLESSPKSAGSSPFDTSMPSPLDLPSREVARQLCANTLDDATALMRFVHQPSFFKKFDRIFATDPEHFTTADIRFLPLVYFVMAVGCLFASTENSTLSSKGYEDAIDQGYHYYQAGKQMLDITDCRDLTTLQSVCFMIIFLQSTAKLSTCYSYLGIALRACCRLGLHRQVINEFNPVEREERKRCFWIVRRFDTYVSAMLGLPSMLSDEDVDQELPIEVDDEYISEDCVRPMPYRHFSLQSAANAHTKLVFILQKVVRFIYPIKGFKSPEDNHPGDGYSISHSRIRNIERDLQTWMDELPMELRPTDLAARDLARVQQLLRLSYAHVQMMLYRPFLHYVSQGCEAKGVDKRSFACAAACVSVARNIVHITTEMKKKGLLVGAYWFVMYTTYLAILALVFFVLENSASPTGTDILKDAMEGRETLASLAKKSLAADRCSQSLANLFSNLPEVLQERNASISKAPSARSSKKRTSPLAETTGARANHSDPNVASPKNPRNDQHSPGRASSFPHDLSINVSKPSSLSESVSLTPLSLDEQDPSHRNVWNVGSAGGMTKPTISAAPLFSQDLGNPNLPDMKPVMFPGDNPFAYPNQPMSTLEAQHRMSAEQPSSYSSPASGIMYNVGGGNDQTPTTLSFDDTQMPSFAGSFNMPPHFMQQERQMSSVISGGPAFDTAPQMDEPADVDAINLPGGEGYWSQMDRASGGRTGLTPGGVNLDELFGGEGWNNIWNTQSFAR